MHKLVKKKTCIFCIIFLLSEYLEHWIASIRTYARSEKAGYPKIILIGTHKDKLTVCSGFISISNFFCNVNFHALPLALKRIVVK